MAVNAEINVVSLIDVMMLLMIVFMIAAPMMQGGVDVQLPRAQAQPLEAKGGLVISVDQAGRIFIDRQEVSFTEFEGSIKVIADRAGRNGVYVRGDKDGAYGNVVRVLAVLTANGITDVGLVAEPEEVRR
jgi:biopolymer transport protein ExbD/biopolymer transport protein TolR